MKRTAYSRIAAVLIAAAILLSSCLCGCSFYKQAFPIEVSDFERSCFELCKTKYTDAELEEIYSLMRDKNDLDELDSSYPVECLRKDDDGCHIIYVGAKKLLVLRFDDQANWEEQSKLDALYYVTKTRGYFDELKIGDSITKVQSIDATCFYPFLLDGSDAPKESDHYTEDGYHTHISYDDDLKIAALSYDVG